MLRRKYKFQCASCRITVNNQWLTFTTSIGILEVVLFTFFHASICSEIQFKPILLLIHCQFFLRMLQNRLLQCVWMIKQLFVCVMCILYTLALQYKLSIHKWFDWNVRNWVETEENNILKNMRGSYCAHTTQHIFSFVCIWAANFILSTHIRIHCIFMVVVECAVVNTCKEKNLRVRIAVSTICDRIFFIKKKKRKIVMLCLMWTINIGHIRSVLKKSVNLS